MTPDPAVVTAEESLQRAAALMVNHDCGCIPVVKDRHTMRLMGVITDRDIVCRTLAEGRNPLETKVSEAMSTLVVTADRETSLFECTSIMEANRVRRLPVVDLQKRCIGIVSQADLARNDRPDRFGELMQTLSKPMDDASIAPARY